MKGLSYIQETNKKATKCSGYVICFLKVYETFSLYSVKL